MEFGKSLKIYFLLIFILALCSVVNVFLPQGSVVGQYELPASKPIVALAVFFIMLFIYGGLGLAGLLISRKLEFAEIWDDKISNKQRFVIPAFVGASIGIFFIFADMVFSRMHFLGAFPHPPFPASVTASINAGIGEEIIFRLFFISFWVWLLSFLSKGKWRKEIFWFVSLFSAFAFSFGHIPSVMALFGFKVISEIPILLIAEIIFLNGVLSLFAAFYFKKYGFLAAVGIHFWTDIIWHVFLGSMMA